MHQRLSPSKSTQSLTVSNILSLNHPFTFQVHSQSNQDHSPHLPCKQQQTQHSEYRQHLQKQYKMRIDSLIKGYQLKINRQRQTYQLKQMKLIEQIEYLKRQLKQLCNINKQTKTCNDEYYCRLCSNGQIITFMKNMLQAVQSQHKCCVVQKNTLNNQMFSLSQKTNVLQLQIVQDEQRYKKLKQQYKQLKIQKQNWQRQKRQKQRQFRQIQRNCQIKQMAFQQQTVKNKLMQKQLQSQIKKIQIQHIDTINKIKQQVNHKQKQQNVKMVYNQSQKDLKRQYKPQSRRQHVLTNRYEYPIQNQSQLDKVQPLNNYRVGVQSLNNFKVNLTRYQSKGSLQARAPLKNSINLNLGHKKNSASFWKSKGEQSYADYANNKRKGKKIQNKSEIYQNYENFDTFRPRKSYI